MSHEDPGNPRSQPSSLADDLGLVATITRPGPTADVAEVAPQLHVGDVLLGRFRLDRCLGTGSSGVVFAATDLFAQETLALKALRAPRAHRSGAIKADFRAVRDLHHPNLLTVYELFVHGTATFMTMELVEGVPLTHVARPAAVDGNFNLVKCLFAQCAAGLRKDPDVDGDGTKNHQDDDVDGDGKANGEDDDVDGGGKANGEDDDVDGDGKANGEDEDVDGDGKANGDDDDVGGGQAG